MVSSPEPVLNDSCADERAELEAVIAAALRPASNMAQLLRYVCEKHFAGLTEEIKEYNIAVEALRRPPTFDPSKDSIVRVEAHRLRTRLESFYQQAGATHAIRIVIPAGTYVPQFLYRDVDRAAADLSAVSEGEVQNTPVSPPTAPPGAQDAWRPVPREPRRAPRTGLLWGACIAFVVLAIAWLVQRSLAHTAAEKALPVASFAESTRNSALQQPNAVRILTGVLSPTFVDALGVSWTGDRYFSGGSAESISPKAIAFASDPSIFLHRRRGAFAYTIPLNPGSYELRLYFADAFFGENNPDGGGESSRVFDVKANGRSLLRNFDVISDAGGSNTADVKVFRAIQPDASGKLHLQFLPKRDVAFVNAIEIVPTPDGRTTPLRMVMAKRGYQDAAGSWWEPDHFFRGGVSFSKPEAEGTEAARQQPESERFGNFVYAIPVASDRTYKATFTFREIDTAHLLGDSAGERFDVFSVHVNGRPLVEDLQVRSDKAASGTMQRTFTGLRPNPQDKLIFSFVPVKNYALVNSVEIVETNDPR